MANTQDSRILIKRSNVAGELPSVAPSSDHTDGTWSKEHIYVGELFINVADDRTFLRTTGGIKELSLAPSGTITGLQETTISLSSAQVLTSNSSPIVSISAVTGKYIIVERLWGEYTFGTVAYATATNIALRYTGAGANINIFSGSFLTGGASKNEFVIDFTYLPVISTGVELFAVGADPTAGDGTYKINVLYRIIEL